MLLPLALAPGVPAAPPEACWRPAAQHHADFCDWDEDGVPDAWYATTVQHGTNLTSEGNRSGDATWTFNRVERPGQALAYLDAYRWSNGTHNHTWATAGVQTHRHSPFATQALQASLACRGEGHAGQCDEAWWDARVVAARLGRTQSVTLVLDDGGTWACAFGAATLGCVRLLP